MNRHLTPEPYKGFSHCIGGSGCLFNKCHVANIILVINSLFLLGTDAIIAFLTACGAFTTSLPVGFPASFDLPSLARAAFHFLISVPAPNLASIPFSTSALNHV